MKAAAKVKTGNTALLLADLERYRSGHNGAVLKTVRLHGHMGSNPILSATGINSLFYF